MTAITEAGLDRIMRSWRAFSVGLWTHSISSSSFFSTTRWPKFGVSKKAIIFTTTATLALRPLGAFLFGLLADRYGPPNSADGERHLFR